MGNQTFPFSSTNVHTSYNSPTISSMSELAPYCGLHKIGGLAVQPQSGPTTAFHSTSSTLSLPMTMSRADEEPDPWSLPSSQDSTYSLDSNVNTPPRTVLKKLPKRALELEADVREEDGENEGNMSAMAEEIHNSQTSTARIHRRGSSYPFSHTRMPDLTALLSSSQTATNSNRTFATPRSRSKFKINVSAKTEESGLGLGQENLAFGFGCGFRGGMSLQINDDDDNDDDFADAAFLRRREDVEMHGC